MNECASESLHVAQISFFNDPLRRDGRQLLEAWPTLVDVAESAARACARVSIIQSSCHVEELQANGVDYYFRPCGPVTRVECLARLLQKLEPDVLHVHGLGFPQQVVALAARLPQVPLVLQDHANRPPAIWRRAAWRKALAAADGVSFCAREQAQPFVEASVLGKQTPVYEIPESTSRFAPADQAAARRATGLFGEPAILSVGHLSDNKDPLTVLDGVSAATRALPGLRLWCCFGQAPLLRQVKERIAADARLCGSVHLLGNVPHHRVEQLMRAADIFVQGSHRESTGYSLIEALACGLTPVVTDIPSFRVLTGNAAVGRLWPCGSGPALTCALLTVASGEELKNRAAVRAHFEREFSFGALGRKLGFMYRDVIGRAERRTRAVSSGH
jgi:glycosyltransferase involved in cell wall biosynthesis